MHLILVRHGESLWNRENRFTGWVDVPLTEKGREEAKRAGKLIKGYRIDVAYTSVLSRATETLDIILEEMGVKVPIIRDQALNERHYGNLQGLNKEETARIYGEEQVKAWRRSYSIRPPGGESLEDTQKRTVPFFKNCILMDVKLGKNVLVVAHGNSLRSIVMYIENISPEKIPFVEIPTGVPIVYLMSKENKMIDKKVLNESNGQN
ncbi:MULTISPECIES: 2,3-diphosphoglycerate-dependent phosphoglycerate mutase [Acidianus]|uniref:2,3-bisphosphoglycerate-dependent phosphoglycerate mutase n=1 Tax=Candidatus Acidianus copahuensis TaxID=1160895 RepID=A0A031LW62_9CREN|nr:MULTISPECIES: 2,3-bisphosphoglycerate-dependent phosphoglycerate mutase [Acidianus]EZQ12046.1 phosphoglyceromutase [Candidatus Acidianus copahuensis]NON63060.1 2,3-bisphosphoglycerate-dependent phosphoglycerate mutase [Acidianus sp. RZ1]